MEICIEVTRTTEFLGHPDMTSSWRGGGGVEEAKNLWKNSRLLADRGKGHTIKTL